GVAEEGSRLEVLRSEERAPGGRGAVRDRLERAPFQAGEAAARRWKLLEQAAERKRLLVDGYKLRERDRLRCAYRVPGLPCCGEQFRCGLGSLRPERLELVGGQLAEPTEVGLARERAHDDQLDRCFRPACKCQRIDQLELIEEVVLEPENDARPAAQRFQELLVATSQRGANR